MLSRWTDFLTTDGEKVVISALFGELPTGVFVRHLGTSYLVLGRRLLEWAPHGYVASLDVAPEQQVDVLTPRSVVEVLRVGYDADVHESALSFV